MAKVFYYRTFDVAIKRGFVVEKLRWPLRDEASEDAGLGGNRDYIDLRYLSWRDASRVLEREREMMRRIESLEECDPDSDIFQEELVECERYLFGLDLGVASSVIALSAATCVPFSCCNAGAFGDHHQEKFPLVAFYTRRNIADLILAAAEESGIGLQGDEFLIAFSDDIRKMPSFASALISRRRQFVTPRH